MASDLEELAASGQFVEARPLVQRLETMVRGPIRQLDGQSIERLHRRAATAGS